MVVPQHLGNLVNMSDHGLRDRIISIWERRASLSSQEANTPLALVAANPIPVQLR